MTLRFERKTVILFFLCCLAFIGMLLLSTTEAFANTSAPFFTPSPTPSPVLTPSPSSTTSGITVKIGDLGYEETGNWYDSTFDGNPVRATKSIGSFAEWIITVPSDGYYVVEL